MSQNNQINNELAGYGLAAALVGAMMLMFFLLIYAVLLFVAFGLTIFALCAWFKPFTLVKHTLEPEEARAFIKRGLIGAFLLPAFVVFYELVFGIRINGDYLLHIILGGYVLGSLGGAMLEETNEGEAETGQTIDHIPAPQIPPPKGFLPPGYGQTPSEGALPFRFASWDDEEERS